MRASIWGLLALLAIGATAVSRTTPREPRARPTAMSAFGSDRDFIAFMQRIARHQRTRQPGIVMYDVAAPAPPAMDAESVVVTAAKSTDITNTQEHDVDEGGIVKVVGDHLVILRRGRLFTVSLSARGMRPIDHLNAFPPGTSGSDSWYDEMLVVGDRIIVVGYSYQRAGTEINRFRLSPAGKLRFEDSYHLRSNDYYSSSNYASRLVGSSLILYTPLYLDAAAPLENLPALRRWSAERKAPFVRTLSATRLYVPAPIRRSSGTDASTLHTVTRCNLAAEQLDCRAIAVLGSASRTFYVSGSAVYVWTSNPAGRSTPATSLVYRLPLDGSAPSAVQAWGGPVDQFSFAEDRVARRLNVVVRANTGGDAMWQPERSAGATALLTLPLSAFGDGSRIMRAVAYRPLPIEKEAWNFHNRFAGRHLIYSAGAFNEHSKAVTVYAAPLNRGPVARISVPHGVDRIDLIGSDAIVIGNDMRERLGFSAIDLGGGGQLSDTYYLPAAHEGERRSQAFFFRPDDNSPDGASGMLGLPIARELDASATNRFLGSGSAIAFLRRNTRRLAPAGELTANVARAKDDACEASCVDWYGNARPIFLGDRVFALMGYELVEGRVAGGLIGERARVDFTPATKH